ncbi:DUF397 domain-containing protein [Streptomyces sp. NPDC052236]|uniref:DUF397 domain-containing protein n=1 Tax=Streptomyces sp. NPDC052236 TaxID=3365686 RepID=UPI0037D6883D
MSSVTCRKNSYTNGEGGLCVEVAQDFPGAARWRKSNHSDATSGERLGVANIPGIVPVRDSKRPHGPVLLIPAHSWAPFISALK